MINCAIYKLGLLCSVAIMVLSCQVDSASSRQDYKHPLTIKLLESPRDGGLKETDKSYWGASVIKGDDGLFHAFITTFCNNCGVNTWKHNSEIIHATSKHPLGPFQPQETVVEAMGHNPSIRRASNGKYVLYYIGQPTLKDSLINCEGKGITPRGWKAPYTLNSCYINYKTANDLDGPWSEAQTILDINMMNNCPTNPSPVIHKDGSVNLYYRDYTLFYKDIQRKLFVSQAPSYDGSYTKSDAIQILDQLAEDPYVWQIDGQYHLIFNNKFKDRFNTGGYATSTDGLKFNSQKPMYSLAIDFNDGITDTIHRRERPHFLRLDEKRAVLYTAVWESKDRDYSYVLATPVGEWTDEELRLK
ncbi:MAG: glycoside hydrolase family protein [Carboxylicivirga sp.]|jgi:hypothetical protein|nr:glycoside hydrolase family protein [Carboxylicivirga sp.]